jgi:hypothetical protein
MVGCALGICCSDLLREKVFEVGVLVGEMPALDARLDGKLGNVEAAVGALWPAREHAVHRGEDGLSDRIGIGGR